MNLIDQLDAVLPQTQCTQCGYDGCRPYAAAMASGKAKHNQCPPGGERVIGQLADLLAQPVMPLNSDHGVHSPKHVAVIQEDLCIGCTKCIQACPVDAIFGANKVMHTVITSECTGCELCVEPCPMDCIDMVLAPDSMQPDQQTAGQRQSDSDRYRQRHQARKRRLARIALEERNRYRRNKIAQQKQTSLEDKQALIQAAIVRAKNRQQNKSKP